VTNVRDAERVGPLALDDADGIEELRRALDRAGYRIEQIEDVLQVEHLSSRPADVALQLRRLAPSAPFGTLVRLFLLGAPASRADAEAAFAPMPMQRLVALGVLEELPANEVRGAIKLVPHGGVLIASDHERDGEPVPEDVVVGVHPPSVVLAKLAVWLPVERALDVGTGNGIQALFAAQHCKHVIATDVSQRALDFAAFNARLNAVDNIEFRRGSFFEPVEGERFDLVLCNPPYLISPDSLYAYRDSGMGGDTVSSELVRRAPEVLVEGGFAHLLVSWIRREDDEWTERLRDWTAGSGCDALFLHYQTEQPIDHAESWLVPLAAGPLADYESSLDRWLDYFSREQIASISHGAVMLRRRKARKNWTRAEELPTNRLLPASIHVLRIVAAEDFLEGLARPEDLLDERLALVESHQLDQRLACRDGGLAHLHTSLSLDEGLGFVIGVDLETAELLPALDGARTVRVALAARARDGGLDPDRLAVAALPVIRRLFELGFLERIYSSSSASR
jgi:SAM-dependent methyltransferase